MKDAWFRTNRPGRGVALMAKPLTWQGWSIQIGAIVVVLLLAQAAVRWASIGFQPLAAGVWLVAGAFMLTGLYLKAVKHFSATPAPDHERG